MQSSARQVKQKAEIATAANKDQVAAAFDVQKYFWPLIVKRVRLVLEEATKSLFTVTELKLCEIYYYFWSKSECNKGSCETGLQKYIVQRSGEGIKY